VTHALIHDRGDFVTFARGLAPAATVEYFSEWRDTTPELKNRLVGRDLEDVTRVDDFWAALRAAGKENVTVCFPDVGDGDLQIELRRQGYTVFGVGPLETLELDRWAFLELLRKLGLPTPATEIMCGLDEIATLLRKKRNLWVKASMFRGDAETFFHRSWELSEEWWQDKKATMGPGGDELELLAQEDIPATEIGYDGPIVDGNFPPVTAWGIERKAAAYLGAAVEFSDLPAPLLHALRVLQPELRRRGGRGLFSVEQRVTDEGAAYVTDPCCRCPWPPIALLSRWMENFGEVMLGAAAGRIVTPRFRAAYGAEVILHSDWLERHFLPVRYPAAIAEFIRIRRPVVFGEQVYGIPKVGMTNLGSAVAWADTPAAAVRLAEDRARQVEGHLVEWDKDAGDAVLDSWEHARELFGTHATEGIG